jgi:UDP-N-acetylmuramyl pentapeptide synthase
MTRSSPRSVDLTALLASLGDARISGSPLGSVGAIEYDSRRVRPGDLFVALRGQATDGQRLRRARMRWWSSRISI